MMIHRRELIRLAGAAAAFPALSRIAKAQAYPSRPVRIVVGYAAGGGVRHSPRAWSPPGCRTGSASSSSSRTGPARRPTSPPSWSCGQTLTGYTLLLVNAANAINASVFDRLNFEFTRDMTAVGGIMRVAFVIVVNPSLPVKTVPELIAHAKANPYKLGVGTSGAGGPDQASAEYFKMETGTQMLDVPYRGLGPALVDLLGGQVQLVFATLPSAIEYIRAGKLRPLAVTTAAPSDALPGVPTLSSFLPGFDSSQWYGLGAPKGTPPDVVAKLNEEINAGLADPKFKARIADLGGVPMPMAPGEFDNFIAAETTKWAKVTQYAGIKVK